MDSCSGPVPIPACVIDRQAEEIARLVRCRGRDDADIGVGVPEHVNPIEWDDVIPCGRYILDRKLIRRSPALQPIPAAIRAVPERPRPATASPRPAAPATPADSQAAPAPWRLHAEAAALAVDADQLRGEADDLTYRAQAHQARAERLRDRLERLARTLDPPGPGRTAE